MKWSIPMAWLSALSMRRARPHPGDVDGADMGTAFGLDASLGPVEEFQPAADATREPAPLPWEHRLTRRVGL